MYFFAVLNKELPLGKSLNALAHMALGLGHRISHGMPGVKVYFGSPEQVRQFRTMGRAQLPTGVHSDFTDTMTGETAIEQLRNTNGRKESDLVYYGACTIASEQDLLPLQSLLNQCMQSKNYHALTPIAEVTLTPEVNHAPHQTAPDMKASMVVKKGLSLGMQINQAVRACLEVGKNAPLEDLHLLNFVDADNNAHQHISYHPFPITTPASPAKHKTMAEKASKATGSISRFAQYSATDEGNPILSVIFGERAEVESIFTKKETSFYRQEFSADDLVKQTAEVTTMGLLRKSMKEVLSVSVPSSGPTDESESAADNNLSLNK